MPRNPNRSFFQEVRTMKEVDDFGNPNREALHPAFRRKDSVRVSFKVLAKLNPGYRNGVMTILSQEEREAMQQERAEKQG
jgi:hypothetical protein